MDGIPNVETLVTDDQMIGQLDIAMGASLPRGDNGEPGETVPAREYIHHPDLAGLGLRESQPFVSLGSTIEDVEQWYLQQENERLQQRQHRQHRQLHPSGTQQGLSPVDQVLDTFSQYLQFIIPLTLESGEESAWKIQRPITGRSYMEVQASPLSRSSRSEGNGDGHNRGRNNINRRSYSQEEIQQLTSRLVADCEQEFRLHILQGRTDRFKFSDLDGIVRLKLYINPEALSMASTGGSFSSRSTFPRSGTYGPASVSAWASASVAESAPAAGPVPAAESPGSLDHAASSQAGTVSSHAPVRYSQEKWAEMMPIIKRLYLDENYTVPEIVKELNEEHGFYVSKGMVKHRLSEYEYHKRK